MLKNRRVLIASLSAMVSMVLMFFFESILSDHLIVDIKVSDNDIGYFFGVICLVYAISAPLIGWLCRNVKRRYVSQTAFLVAAVALFCFGPSKLLGLPPKSIVLTVTGLALLGIGAAAIFVPLLSEIIEAVQL